MINRIAEPVASYGGEWTHQKLDILEDYLNAYTTALKNQHFRLLYIDAFAGTGYVELHGRGCQIFHPWIGGASCEN